MRRRLETFASLTDPELLEEVHSLVARHRDITAALIAALAELDTRKLYLGEGFPSLYAYCTECLHLSEHEAYNRIEAARVARGFPVVLDMLASGELTMTAVNLLGNYLTEENHLALLNAARHKSKKDIEAQLGMLRPKPDVPSRLTPLGDGRYTLQVTLSAEDVAELRRLQELMRHSIPNGEPAAIISRALTHLRTTVERRRLATVRRPRPARAGLAGTRYIPAAVRRAVYARDGDQCAFVGHEGRCQERGFLELHHVRPYVDGGPSTVDNLQLRCRAHNQYEEHLREPATG